MLAQLANYLAENQYTVEIITYDGSLQSIFPLHNSIKITTLPLGFLKYTRNNLPKLLAFFGDIKAHKALKPQVDSAAYLIATDQIIATVIYMAFKKKAGSIIVWEHLPYAIQVSKIWLYFRKKIYPRVKAVIALNREEEAWYKSQHCNTIFLQNAVPPNPQVALQTSGPLVWVAALIKEKGIDGLIELGKLIKQRALNTQLHVYGAGADKDYFINAIAVNNLENTIVYKKTEKDISVIFSGAMALIVTSKQECLPTVILEAFSFGIPVIAYDCPSGPRNMITPGVNGFLVAEGDTGGIFAAVVTLQSNQALLQQMGNDAKAASAEYAPEKLYPQWHTILV